MSIMAVQYYSLKIPIWKCKYVTSFQCPWWLRHVVLGEEDCNVKQASVIYNCKIVISGKKQYFTTFDIHSVAPQEAYNCLNHLRNFLDEMSLDWYLW